MLEEFFKGFFLEPGAQFFFICELRASYCARRSKSL